MRSFARRGRARGPQQRAAVPAREPARAAPTPELVSRLLPLVFRNVDPNQRLNVLDVGLGCSAAIQFLGRFRCQVAFADLFDEFNGDPKPGLVSVRRFFEETPDVRYDICLFWDFLNYLSADDLREFGMLLRERLHDGSRGHAFAAFTAMKELSGCRFELRDHQRVGILAEAGPTPYRHTNKVLGGVLWPLNVSRAVLLESNRQELLLAANGAK